MFSDFLRYLDLENATDYPMFSEWLGCPEVKSGKRINCFERIFVIYLSVSKMFAEAVAVSPMDNFEWMMDNRK